jgi:hypothetical protein
VRYEVIGTLRGTLEVSDTARVVNLSDRGALVETSKALAVGAHQTICVTLDGHMMRLTARVRHLTEIGGDPKRRYSIGVEFISPPDALAVSVGRLTDVRID